MLDAVEAVSTDSAGPLHVLDLAGGTGSISLRLLRRRPDARPTLVDLDPALLAIARATIGDRATIVPADLRRSDWTPDLPDQPFDAVLTATALHWLSADRLRALYSEVRDLLHPGAIMVNADHMPDNALPGLTKQLVDRAETIQQARHATGAAPSWRHWWQTAAADPALGPLIRQRDQVFGAEVSHEWTPPASWHLDVLREAGYRETGLLWRSGPDAAVVAVR
jgi:trans-aconitate methyltransferase